MDFFPLISLKSCGYDNYFLWIDDCQSTSLMLKVTDGYKVWEQSMEAERSKPKSRKESPSEYTAFILQCLQNLDSEKRTYTISVTSSGSLQFMIKEKLGQMMALLLKLDMVENYDSTTCIRGILQGMCGAGASSTQALSLAMTEIQLNRQANDSLSQTVMSYAASKEEFQNNFFRKMCIVLNSKKREIVRLQGEVVSLEDEVSSLQAKANTIKAKPTAKTKPKPKGKVKKSTKKYESEEEEGDNFSVQSESESDGDGDGDDDDDDDDDDTSQDEDDHPRRSPPSSRAKRKVKASAHSPPSYSSTGSTALKKRKTSISSAVSSQSSQNASQIISQVLAPAAGALETTGKGLTKMLSQSTRGSRRTRASGTQEVPAGGKADEDEATYKYGGSDEDDDDFDGNSGGESDNGDGGGDDGTSDGVASVPVAPKAAVNVTAKRAKKNAFDKLYNSDSSSEEEGLMDYL